MIKLHKGEHNFKIGKGITYGIAAGAAAPFSKNRMQNLVRKSKSNFDQLLSSLNTFNIFSIFFYLSISIFWYHILTGIRHLIMDFFHVGESLNGSYYSSIFTLVLWVLTSIIFFGYLFI